MAETKYDCMVFIGNQAFEVPKTTREALLDEWHSRLSVVVGQRPIVTFPPGGEGGAAVLMDINIPGLAVQILSKKDAMVRRAEQQRQQGMQGLQIPQGLGMVPGGRGRG